MHMTEKRRSPRFARGFVIAGGAVAFVLALVFGARLWCTRWPFPRTRGLIRVDGLAGPAEIIRDRFGVPHIYAGSAEDLFFAQGFVHAQDRFWQMEFWRRIASGRLSELFGKSTLEIGKFMRTLGFHQVAQREYEHYSPEAGRYLEAYSAWVNAYVLHRRRARRGLEFCDQILARAFRKGYRAASKRLGEKSEGWQWGKVHRAEFRNQSFGESATKPIERIFNRGPVAVSGGNTTIAVAAWNMKKAFEVKHIASQRMLLDLGNLGRSRMANTTGQSGHPFHPHYNDSVEAWRNVRYHPAHWERGQVLTVSRERLRLVPKTGRQSS